MNANQIDNFAEIAMRLSLDGVWFSFFTGVTNYNLSVEELVEFAIDPIAFQAKLWGCSEQEFLDWKEFVDDKADTQCRVITNGKRCKRHFGDLRSCQELQSPKGYAKHPKLCEKHMKV